MKMHDSIRLKSGGLALLDHTQFMTAYVLGST